MPRIRLDFARQFSKHSLYYKDHLHLIENGNIKFSKLIIKTLQDVLSPQSSQSSTYLSQSSLIRSLPPSSLPRSNLSVQTLSQTCSSQSLSATATPFNQKRQIILHNSPNAPPKSQTLTHFSPVSHFYNPRGYRNVTLDLNGLTASPPFRQDFSSSLKTTSDHMSSAKPTKLITSPTSAGSSFDTLQSSQLNFNHHLIFHSTYICCNFFSIYSYFSILSYTHNSLLIFCSSIYILPSSRTSSSIKSTTCTSRFFFKCCATRY